MMLDQIERYEAYRSSGIPWMAEVPSHWGIQRAKWLFEKMERPVRPEDDVVTAFRDGQVTLRTNRRTEGFTNAIQEHGYQGIRKGDLVIHAMDAFAGAIGVSDSDGKSSPVYSACVPRGLYDVDASYYAYIIRYIALSGYILSLAKGIRERSTDFRFKDFGDMELPVPDLDTQRRIVTFLDEKTAEIDEAIGKKRRLIELLNEQKAILINRAVTRGLDPAIPMKDSGVDWFGEIPAHWEVKPLIAVGSLKSISGQPERELLSVYLDRGVIRFSDVDEKRTNATSEDLSAYQIVDHGDLVLNNQQAWRGSVGVSPHAGIVSPAYIVLALSDVFDLNYANLLFRDRSMVAQYLICSKGVGTIQRNLYWPKIKRASVIIPPMGEQIEIAEFVAKCAAETDAIIVAQTEQINALTEFKQTLIANAVTGKIKI